MNRYNAFAVSLFSFARSATLREVALNLILDPKIENDHISAEQDLFYDEKKIISQHGQEAQTFL